MSYESVDTSEQDGQPVLLFTFIRGSTVWYYCAGNEAFSYGGHTFDPVPLLPGNFAVTGEVPKDTLELELPISNGLAANLLAYVADKVMTLTVQRVHRTDAEARVVWKGRYLRHTASVGTVKLTCEPVSTSMQRLGLRQVYQRLCRHVFGGIGCYVDIEDYAEDATVTALAGTKVYLSAAPTLDFEGGTLLAPDGTRRMIVSVASDHVVLLRPMQSLRDSLQANPAGFAVTLYQGCDRSTTMCAARFGNIGNHGGFPGIQWINPMTDISSVFG